MPTSVKSNYRNMDRQALAAEDENRLRTTEAEVNNHPLALARYPTHFALYKYKNKSCLKSTISKAGKVAAVAGLKNDIRKS
jgi:hypothetical protein